MNTKEVHGPWRTAWQLQLVWYWHTRSHCCRLNKLKSRVNSDTVPHYMHVSILDHVRHLSFELSRSLKVKCDGSFGLPKHDFLLVFYSNIWPNTTALRDISLWNLSDLDIDPSRLLKVKCDSVIGLLIMVSYQCLIVTYGLPQLLYKIQSFKIWVILTLTFQCHSRSNVMVSLDSPYMLCYWYIYSNHMSVSRRCYSHSKCFLLSRIIRPKLRKIESAPNDQRYPYILNYYTIARFPDNWAFSP